MKRFTLLITALLFAGAPSLAHEGHDHDAPSTSKPQKGGVVRGLEELNVEVVLKGNEIRLFLFDKDMKARSTDGVKISAVAELPRKKGAAPLTLVDKGDHFQTEFDAKGSHRFDLKLKVTDPRTGHEDDLKFTLEPRRG